tara:strand:+ start:119 stop:778 length:660 start_codon:yes stop_codon:yes gene_type:complete
MSTRRVVVAAFLLIWGVYSLVNNEPSWGDYVAHSAVLFLTALLIIAVEFLPAITIFDPKEPFCPELVAQQVSRLYSENQEERIDAIRTLKDSDNIFADYGQALSNKNAFFAIETLSAICLEQQKPLYPETVQFCYEVMMADAFDANYECKSVRERLKRTLLPLCPHIQTMEERFGKELTVDSKLVRHWLQSPISDWDWLITGVTHSMITDCQNRRMAGY